MIVTVRFEGKSLSFDKTVELNALPDVGDDVKVKPVGDWVEKLGDEPVQGTVERRGFVECCDGHAMQCVIEVRQASPRG